VNQLLYKTVFFKSTFIYPYVFRLFKNKYRDLKGLSVLSEEITSNFRFLVIFILHRCDTDGKNSILCIHFVENGSTFLLFKETVI